MPVPVTPPKPSSGQVSQRGLRGLPVRLASISVRVGGLCVITESENGDRERAGHVWGRRQTLHVAGATQPLQAQQETLKIAALVL